MNIVPQQSLGAGNKFDRSVTLVSWAYNEEELIEEFLQRALDLMDVTVEDFEVIVVDDCSTDRTGLLLDKWSEKDSRIKVIHNAKNMNVGLSARVGISAATKELLFWQTIDWSYDISPLRTFLELTRYYDVVQGIRPVPVRSLSYIPVLRSIYRVRSRSDNLYKAFISLGNYYLVRTLFRVHFHDFQNVTFYRTQTIQNLKLSGKTAFVNPELLIRTYASGSRFIEVPISFIPRKKGKAKGTKFMFVIRSLIDVLNNWVRWGWRLEHAGLGKEEQIHRVMNPFQLSQEVLELIYPLFKHYR